MQNPLRANGLGDMRIPPIPFKELYYSELSRVNNHAESDTKKGQESDTVDAKLLQ